MPRILSLNDDETILQVQDIILNREGYQHLYTTDSHHALSLLRKQPIDLFIQDILRPDINGFALYWRMKSEEKLCDIPMLISSFWDSARVKVTPVRAAGRTLRGLLRAEFEGVQPEHLTGVGRNRQANVLYIEGFMGSPWSISKLLNTIKRILRSQSLLTEGERALRYQYLWSQAVRRPGDGRQRWN